MMTVPCCDICQEDQKGDDEYFRTFLTMSIGSDRTKSGHAAMMKVVGEHQKRRERSPNARSYFQPELKPVENTDGEYIGDFPQASVDVPRIEKICWRIHRGIIYHHYQQFLPKAQADFQMQIVNGTTVLFEGEEEARRIQEVTNHPSLDTHVIGDDDVCTYQVSRVVEEPLATIVRILYFKSVLVIGTTFPINHPKFDQIEVIKQTIMNK